MGYQDSKLFVYNTESWQNALETEYLIPEPAEAREYQNAIIEPLRFIEGSTRHFGTGLFSGGVCTSDFEHIAGQLRSSDGKAANKSCMESYEVSEEEIAVVHERVIYGGVLTSHFGHMLCDGLSRLWYPCSHPEDDAKIAFVMMYGESKVFWNILEAVGIPEERVLVIEQPTRFDGVLVPDETMFSLGKHGVKDEWRKVGEAIRANAEPSPYKKVYFTRTSLDFSGCIGEEYFEDFFRAKGFEIIAPETLSFKEQVSIVAGAEELACTMGSVMLHTLYASPDTKLTVINRSTGVPRTEILAAFVGDVETYYVDVYRNILPEGQAGGCVWLLADTQEWRDYLAYRGWADDPEAQAEYPLADNMLEYIKTWGTRYQNVGAYSWIRNEMLTDVVWRVNKYLLDTDLDMSEYGKPNKLLNAIDRGDKHLAEARLAWDLGGGYGSVYDHLGGELPEDAARIPYGSEAPYCRIRSVEWLGEETLSLKFKVTHPWIQVGRMRPYIVLRRRLGNKYANKWAEFRGKQDELVLAPEILSFKSNGESHFVVQLSFPQINDLIKLEHGDSLNLYIRYVCDDASRTSEERFGNERPKGTFAIYKSKAPVTGDIGFYPYETGKKYLGFRIMSPKAAELRELARRLNRH